MVQFCVAQYIFRYELHVCCRSVVYLQLALRGGVIFVETVPLDRHNCEETQINLPTTPDPIRFVSLSVCLVFSSLPLSLFFILPLISTV